MDRYESAKKVGLFGIIGNIFLLIIKSTVGFISRSQAMVADAANSAGDIFASLMTFIGNKISSEPKDKTHNFGHGKAEYIFSFLISISMIAISIKLLVDSISSLLNKNEVAFSWFLVITCIVTILTKLFLYFYCHAIYKKHHNLLVKANMKDHRNDCIVTSFTLISVILSIFHIYWIDSIVGIGIAIWISITGIKIFIESYNVLMDISLDEETINAIYSLGKNYEEIKNIHDLSTSPVGYQYIVILTIDIDGSLSTFTSHSIADNLEKDILKMDKICNVIIHVHPV